MTIFATAVEYFSFKEDRLMNWYRTEGYALYAGIVMAGIICGNSGNIGKGSSSDDGTGEYLFVVGNLQEISQNYTVRVRRQLKIISVYVTRTRDHPADTTVPTYSNVINDSGIRIDLSLSLELDSGQGHVIINTVSKTSLKATFTEDESVCYPNRSLIENTSEINIVLYSLEIYRLPGLPKLGYPKIQVQEKCGLKYRVSTLLLVLVNMMIFIFCTYFASRSTIEVESTQQQLFAKCAIVVYASLILLEVPAVYFCLGDTFGEALITEYIENGEFMPSPHEDSTLS